MAGVLRRALDSVEISSKRFCERLGDGGWRTFFPHILYIEMGEEMNLCMVGATFITPHINLIGSFR
jgi:hypothetical protein